MDVTMLYLWLIIECGYGGYNNHTPSMLPVSADSELFTYYHGNRGVSHWDIGLGQHPTLGYCVSNWGTVQGEHWYNIQRPNVRDTQYIPFHSECWNKGDGAEKNILSFTVMCL